MNLLVSELLKLLKGELKAYRQVLSLLSKEREAIADASLDNLLRTNREKEILLLTIETLEKSREVITKKLGDLRGLSPEQLTLSFLVQQIEGPLSSEMKYYQHQLASLIGEATEINKENGRLLQHSHHITGQLMAILSSREDLNPLYLPSGAVRPSSPLRGYNQWQV